MSIESGFAIQLPLPEDADPVIVDHPMMGDDFETLCEKNPELRIEQDRHGKILIMPPVNPTSGHYELELGAQLHAWSQRTKSGPAFSSSTIFTLPNGAKRSPDASWLPQAVWEAVTETDRLRITPVCPHFVVELRSPSDRLETLQDKMAEYIENGAKLGFLVDPQTKRVHVYRPSQEVGILEAPETVSAEPELPGFEMRFQRLW